MYPPTYTYSRAQHFECVCLWWVYMYVCIQQQVPLHVHFMVCAAKFHRGSLLQGRQMNYSPKMKEEAFVDP